MAVPVSPHKNKILDMNKRDSFAVIENNFTMDELHTLKIEMWPLIHSQASVTGKYNYEKWKIV